MSFLQTLLGLAQHHNQQAAGQAVAQSNPQLQAVSSQQPLPVQPLLQRLNMGASDGGNLQQFMGNNQSYDMQGGQYNPGYVPLQQSPVNWQNVGVRGQDMVNPQVQDNGYYWNQ
jgi:hypothetical protein